MTDGTSDRAEARRAARAAREAFAGALAAPVRQGLEQALARQLLPHLAGPPGTLGTYAARGAEIDPRILGAGAAARGWRLAFPRVEGAAPLAFHMATLRDLRPGFRGIAEPPPHLPQVRPDVLLVPLLLADLAGNRLGQGGGHYDRTLAALRAGGPVLAIGLAWDMQIVPLAPNAEWDAPLDAIATPTRFLWTQRAPR